MTRHWDNFSDAAPALIEVARQLRDSLRECEIDYRLIGGLALELQGIDVGTKDIDLLVDEENFDAARNCLTQSLQPQATTEDGVRVDIHAEAPVYTFVGLDSVERPVSFYRLDDIEVDLLGATGPAEKNAMEDIPWLTSVPKGIPVASLQAIAAIKLAVGRVKDMVHVEMIVTALGRKRARIVSRYLRSQDRLRDMPELVDEWEAAIERTALMQPKKRF